MIRENGKPRKQSWGAIAGKEQVERAMGGGARTRMSGMFSRTFQKKRVCWSMRIEREIKGSAV